MKHRKENTVVNERTTECGARPVKTALIGISGYGGVYMNFFQNGVVDPKEGILTAVADPFASSSPHYEYLRQQNIPIYASLTELLREHSPQLVILSSPIPLHQQQCIEALSAGCEVLCEKPLVPLLEDLAPLEEAIQRSGRNIGVGFQWSFSNVILALKQDILANRYGKLLRMKAMVSFPRGAAYYGSSTWKGRIRDTAGHTVMDSIATNAAAHYLHNLFFLRGGELGTAQGPATAEAELYRAKDIETFDTCFMKGRFPDGGEYLYMASHATTTADNPKLMLEFEKAAVSLNVEVQDDCLRAETADGAVFEYGNPFTPEEEGQKLNTMIHWIQGKTAVLPCTVPTIRPHLDICNRLFSQVSVTNFPKGELEESDKGLFAPALYRQMEDCFRSFALPSEAGLSWSAGKTEIEMQ